MQSLDCLAQNILRKKDHPILCLFLSSYTWQSEALLLHGTHLLREELREVRFHQVVGRK